MMNSGIYTKGEPTANQQFRDNTAKAGQMLGVRQVPKRCKCISCGKQRTEATGRHTSAGFVCGMCIGSGKKVC